MEYSINQFRRFTFFLKTVSRQTISAFFKNDIEKINANGILNLEGYQKGNQYFFIVDVLPNKSFNDVKKVFEKGLLQPKALERIYELDQTEIYLANEGQLKTKLGNIKRFVWTLLLEEDPNLIAEYKKAHSIGKAWPEITSNMKSVGVKDMEIYLNGNQAILIMDTKPNFDLEKAGPKWQKLPRENEWQEYVAKFQRTSPESSIQEKWIDMEKINFLQ
ncbi:L-rhamnose mutarotase [uncultured Lutibacter sp.]|uniref:L-rhamnose mutarotase n=1 Tax=uncultured Lutibacter sp. TaxID=437739 RepID=UPI0026365A0B|nr:L-rhamnose mutarotase [uncultured Lutibacter sp.]